MWMEGVYSGHLDIKRGGLFDPPPPPPPSHPGFSQSRGRFKRSIEFDLWRELNLFGRMMVVALGGSLERSILDRRPRYTPLPLFAARRYSCQVASGNINVRSHLLQPMGCVSSCTREVVNDHLGSGEEHQRQQFPVKFSIYRFAWELVEGKFRNSRSTIGKPLSLLNSKYSSDILPRGAVDLPLKPLEEDARRLQVER